MGKIFLYVCAIIICTHNIYSQDIHFSNFYNAPLILNPANTGNYIGNWRIIGNYRAQGNLSIGEYRTNTLAFDIPIYYYKQMGSVGLIFINDNSAVNTLLVNKAYLSVAHFIKVSSKSYLHMGFQFGFVHKKIGADNLSLPDQFDMSVGYFTPDMPTQEVFENQKLSYLDLNWGFIWSRKTGKFNSEIGIAMFHYNTPNEHFLNYQNDLSARYLTHSYFDIIFENKLYLKPKLLFTYQNRASELLFGQDFGFRFNNPNSLTDIHAGAYYRGKFAGNLDSFIATVGFQYKSINVGIGFDFELPNNEVNSYTKTAFELSVQYTRPSTNLKNKTIPCETF
jgi:type IX secretion system PorP/SprF family membrane protein